MSRDSDEELDILENAEEVLDGLTQDLKELYTFRDLFFENHTIEMAEEKNRIVHEKKEVLAKKFESINENRVPTSLHAQFLYLKGRLYNISPTYDARATQSLSKALKLNPTLIEAWNELGECYWKNKNVNDAKGCFEGALKHERNRVALRCLSIILRQESGAKKQSEISQCILNSVDLAKEAVTQDIKDGLSWSVLGNAYLCQFFTIAQDPATLKLCMSAYKQAYQDPIARGQPDLYYNRGIALKYEECFEEALKSFEHACLLDPMWEPPKAGRAELVRFLAASADLARTRGKIKAKRLAQMIQTIDKKMLGPYGPGFKHTFGTRRDVTLSRVLLSELSEGPNEGKAILGKVVGSIHNKSAVPFTFAVVDESDVCVCITVYNLADGRGPIIGDCVSVPEPVLKTHRHDQDSVKYDFQTIRVNNPLMLLVNGKRVGRNQFATTRVSSTYEVN